MCEHFFHSSLWRWRHITERRVTTQPCRQLCACTVSLLSGRHHQSSQPSQPEAQWPMRKCARISGCGSDKLATLEAKDRMERGWERGRESEASFFFSFFLRCALTLKDARWFFDCIRGVLMRALQPPFTVTIIKPHDRGSSFLSLQTTTVPKCHWAKHSPF